MTQVNSFISVLSFTKIFQGVISMDEIKKRRPEFNDPLQRDRLVKSLWCGKVQGLCDGTTCTACHMFPLRDLNSDSILSRPSLTDHRSIGLIREKEE